MGRQCPKHRLEESPDRRLDLALRIIGGRFAPSSVRQYGEKIDEVAVNDELELFITIQTGWKLSDESRGLVRMIHHPGSFTAQVQIGDDNRAHTIHDNSSPGHSSKAEAPPKG